MWFRRETLLRALSCAVGLAVCTGGASASTISFADFSDTSTLSLNSSAVVATGDGDVLRLTQATTFDSGSAFTLATHDISAFSTSFMFRITDAGGLADGTGEPGADGLTFVMQSMNPTVLGSAGGGLGFLGVGNSVAVEFDTWMNGAFNDPSSNHIGIDTMGSVNHGSGAPDTVDVAGQFDDGNLWYAWIDYDGTTLEVRANQTGVMPVAALLTTTIDISSFLGGTDAYLGFTSGTGAAVGNHDIINWNFVNDSGVVPEPATMTLLGLGLAGLALRRRSAK